MSKTHVDAVVEEIAKGQEPYVPKSMPQIQLEATGAVAPKAPKKEPKASAETRPVPQNHPEPRVVYNLPDGTVRVDL